LEIDGVGKGREWRGVISKDAGIVHESFQIKTNRVILDFWPYKLNRQYKSFEKGSMNQIRAMNL
jgi:hypothetical protein